MRSRPLRLRTSVGAQIVAAAVLLSGSLEVPRATAAPGLFVGVTDNALRWRPFDAVAVARDLGVTAFRISLAWAPGQIEPSADDEADLETMVAAAAGLRIVVTVYGSARDAPRDAAARDAYCTYVRTVLERYPTIDDVVIWNEPNLSFFWQPQFNVDRTSAAPAAYEALLARCWDVLHAYRRAVNVVMTTSPNGNDDPGASSNVSHSPGAFIRKMGAAYRASGRTQRIFDTVGHNPYGTSSAEPPALRHLAPEHIAEGDVDRLVQALDDGFGGTGQPVPSACVDAVPSCVAIWYLEAGYQTVPDAARRLYYTGRENDARAVPDDAAAAGEPTQSTQLTAGIELAYCQPSVGAFFNFLLWDEPDLERWQSGVLWVDGGRKSSYAALQQVVGKVATRRVDCAHVGPAASRASADPLVERLEWSPLPAFSSVNDVWSFSIVAHVDATYRATLRRLDGATIATVTGTLSKARPRVVRFPRQRLRPGTYRTQVRLTRKQPPPLTVTRASPAFVVR
jgi:hypothetical protein